MREAQAWSCHHLHQGRKSGQRKRRKIGSEDAKSATKGREGGAGDTWTPGEMALSSLLKGLHQLPVIPQPTATPLPTPTPGGGGAPGSRPLFWGPTPLVLLSLGIEKTDKFKPTTSRTPALHLQFYSSVSVWRGTEGAGWTRTENDISTRTT